MELALSRLLILPVMVLLAGCQMNAGNMDSNTPFFSTTNKLPDGRWELRVDGMYPAVFGCKGAIKGRAEDPFDLPDQTVLLDCVNGPSKGTAQMNRIEGQRFTEMSFSLDNGLFGKTVLK